MSSLIDSDTICALATPPGRGGVGIIRISGPLCRTMAEKILRRLPRPRYAVYSDFNDLSGAVVDSGIALFFPGPDSFTGEDVLELQAHGGYFVLERLLNLVLELGGRLARPGEFSERAFLNNKMDLTQAEAIADLIDSCSAQAARSALRTLQGEFSNLIHNLVEEITALRVYIEASIDFSEEDIDFLSAGKTSQRLSTIIAQLDGVIAQAKQGAILKEGMSVVIAGKPNVGKSSLLNALAGRESAIVTDIAGTTRDILHEQIGIDGMPLHITDTAGLRNSTDPVEQEGIRRALKAISEADRILLIIDAASEQPAPDQLAEYLHSTGFAQLEEPLKKGRLSLIFNKIDLLAPNSLPTSWQDKPADAPLLAVSAKHQYGLQALREHLKQCMGYQADAEGGFIARSRHLEALRKARLELARGLEQLDRHQAGELVAEDLRHAHQYLGEITGEFSTDELLGRIFSSFCVGK
ncbi:MAG: tRNA uridine-5-carboxymethylaminomethyl(34) synthesis GTPase MnmE [Pseudomonadales bacterium]|nr:tRNA uridine-5-carboxymethylaminomethyl(34) synthesis GTPase MnmE [Pseudomonadales bacterium]